MGKKEEVEVMDKEHVTTPIEVMRSVYDLFFSAGEVVEIRAIGGIRGKSASWEGFAGGARRIVSG